MRAIELDPKYAHAHAWRACELGQAWIYGWRTDREATWNLVVGALQTALALDENDSDVHRILAAVNVASDDLDKAMYHQERASLSIPTTTSIVVQHGEILTWLGRPVEGIDWNRQGDASQPLPPRARFGITWDVAYFGAHRYGEAVEAFKQHHGARSPPSWRAGGVPCLSRQRRDGPRPHP
jgi:adenylate cyclase